MLLAAYAVCVVVLALYGLHAGLLAVVAARWGERATPEADEEPPNGEWPVVTVQLPLYNEAHVATRLLDAAGALDYPPEKLHLQVLDDSDDATTARVARVLRRLRARGFSAEHVRRSSRAGYKAGALAHGLTTAPGAFVAVFDADFVPPPDFLRRTLPAFADPGVGCVQARWGHLNPRFSLLTRLQAAGLDAHFAVDHRARAALGAPFNFNGTAGVWRRACIADAGGWHADTLAEDLDLSYRAQLAGWRFVYADDVVAPAELPVELHALRQQQRRWAKGGAEVARKLLPAVLRARLPPRVKALAVAHLASPLAHPFALGLVALHAPAVLAGGLPAALGLLSLAGTAGFVLAHAITARRRTGAAWRGAVLAPLFAAGMAGLAPANAAAVVKGLAGRRTPFERTAKFRVGPADRRGDARRWAASRYRRAGGLGAVAAEAALLVYLAAGAVLLAERGAWGALPFQALALAGAALVLYGNGAGPAGRAPRPAEGGATRRTLAAPPRLTAPPDRRRVPA